MLRILNVNCNGIRKRYKRIQLEELLFANHVGIAAITETHLRKEEVARLRFSHYAVMNECSRKTENFKNDRLITLHTVQIICEKLI